MSARVLIRSFLVAAVASVAVLFGASSAQADPGDLYLCAEQPDGSLLCVPVVPIKELPPVVTSVR